MNPKEPYSFQEHSICHTNNLLSGKGCNICKLSHGARRVARWLDINEIDYRTEWTGHGLKSGTYKSASLRMDFYIKKYKIIIEFDGSQHDQPTTFGKVSDKQALENFKILKYNDERKNKWSKDNSHKMIRIKHNELVSERLEKEFKNILD